jgi:Zn-finger nucleic acid-binding protein
VTCPKCSGKLENYKFIDFVLDRCENCEGVRLDKGELKGILKKAARGPLGAFFERYLSQG